MSDQPAPPLPELPSLDFWTDSQWTMLMAALDAVLPPVTTKSSSIDKFAEVIVPDAQFDQSYETLRKSMIAPPSKETFSRFLRDRPAAHSSFQRRCKRTVTTLSPSQQRALGGVLNLLAGRIGSLFLTGYCTPFHQQPVHVREAIIKSWCSSRITPMRLLAKTLTTMAQMSYVQTSPLFKQVTGYTDVPPDYKSAQGYDFQFMHFDAGDTPQVIETDVVIVGSGPGGAVCARNLAEAGHRVIVVDKSYYYSPSQLPMTQEAGSEYLYENSGFIGSDDSSLAIIAGSCWGGGGTVNWSVSLQTQDFVRQEWAEQHGLPFFTSTQFQDCLDRVCDVVGASTENIRHNHRNQILQEGCARLGWKVATAPQNTRGKDHHCGQCHLGCGSNVKNGPTASWLPAAARAGSRFIEGFLVDEVLFEEAGDTRRATGISGTWMSRDAEGSVSGPMSSRTRRRVVVRAEKVIVSCGALWSPLVLMKSGIQNSHLGKNLHVHPTITVSALYKEDARPWEGAILTKYSTEFENLDNAGHGAKLEPICMVPYTIRATMPWSGGLDMKLSLMTYRQMAGFISLVRDRDSGSVRPDPVTGKPRIAYSPSAFDCAHALEGVICLAKICYVTGATEIRPFMPGVQPFIRPLDEASPTPEDIHSGVNNPDFTLWLDSIRAAGKTPPATPWNSAHQMGTCRMSSSEERGVVDPKGRVWRCEDLYVADASVFPSASGVNPSITTMAIADWISRGIAGELRDAKR